MATWSERFSFFRSNKWRSLLGRSMRFAGAAGIGISILAMILLPIGSVRSIAFFESVLNRVVNETEALSKEVSEVDGILDSAVSVLEGAGNSLDQVEGSLEDTQPVLESAAELLSNQTPTVIENTIEALDAATTGARVVDFVLRGLASLEPLTGVAYDPEQPLDQTIEDISTSLEPLPAVLRQVGGELNSSTTNLNQVVISIGRMTTDVRKFANNVDGFKDQISTVADLVERISVDTGKLAGRVSTVIWTICIVFEFTFLWITLNQIALYYVGQQVIANAREAPDNRA